MDSDGIWCTVGECYDFSSVFEITPLDAKLVTTWKKNPGLNSTGISSSPSSGITTFSGSDCRLVYVIHFMSMHVSA